MSPINAVGVPTTWNASDVPTNTAAPGRITGRAPYLSIQPPTLGRTTIETTVITEKRRPTCVFVPPSSTTWRGSSVERLIVARCSAALRA